MAEQNQIMVEPVSVNSPAAKGDRIDVNLRSCFAASPIYNSELTNQERKEYYQKLVLDGTIVNGNGFNSVSMDYNDSPNLENVDISTHNLPSPYMPNPTSPGPGSLNAADKPTYTGNVPDPANNIEFGSGLGGLVSPSKSASQINQQGSLFSYISGKSYPGSDGQA